MAPRPPVSSAKRNPKARKSATAGPSTLKSKRQGGPAGAGAKQVKTRPGVHSSTHKQNHKKTGGGGSTKTPSSSTTTSSSSASKRRERVYTDKELNLPTLNMITPAGVQKPARGKKKGKIFVDDEESMMTILAMVNAEKEGQIESKMIKARQMEEIREARLKEAERRKEGKKEALEEVKSGLKRKGKGRSNKSSSDEVEGKSLEGDAVKKEAKKKKRVSFA